MAAGSESRTLPTEPPLVDNTENSLKYILVVLSVLLSANTCSVALASPTSSSPLLYFCLMLCVNIAICYGNWTGVSPGEGTGATMSDDDEDQADSDTNLFDGSLDGPDTMGFGPLVPTESERSLMERVRQELKHELKQVCI